MIPSKLYDDHLAAVDAGRAHEVEREIDAHVRREVNDARQFGALFGMLLGVGGTVLFHWLFGLIGGAP